MAIKKTNSNDKRLRKTMALRDVVAKIAKPLFRQRQANLVDLITYWTDIVGEELARVTSPLKLRRYQQQFYNLQEHLVLTIASHPGYGVDLVHQQAIILDRVNQHLGRHAIQSLHFIPLAQTYDTIKAKKQVNRFSQPIDKKKTGDTSYREKINDVTDKSLKLALTKLGNILYNQ